MPGGSRGSGAAPFALSLLICAFAAVASADAQQVPLPLPRPQDRAAGPAAAALPDDPPKVHQAACPALREGLVRGAMGPPVLEGECFEPSPLALTAVGRDGRIALPGRPLVNCPMATALARLAETADIEARRTLGAGLAGIATGPGYECRRRNRDPDARISEHAFANALDISAFLLADGRTVTVAGDWPARPQESREDAAAVPPSANAPAAARFLASVHREACAIFTTVLGPDSNAAHSGHFHFDLGCHGRNCDYYICE